MGKERTEPVMKLQAIFTQVKSSRKDIEELRTHAALVAGNIDRILTLIGPYLRANETFYLKDLKQSATATGQDCTRVLQALDGILRRGLGA